jgi:hypothetical protein
MTEYWGDLLGKTTLRGFIRLMYHAQGVVCPVTLAMHLAAAVEPKPGGPLIRPCVVMASGREPAHWEAYPNHQYISTNGALPCCVQGGCWKSRCQLVGDGDMKDTHNVCERPVDIREDLCIPKCMEMITPEDVIRRVEMYFQAGGLHYGTGVSIPRTSVKAMAIELQARETARGSAVRRPPTTNVLIRFCARWGQGQDGVKSRWGQALNIY